MSTADSIASAALQSVDVAKLLDENRFSRRQLVNVACCGLLLLLDGYDTMAIAYVAPSLITQWHLAPSMLGLIFAGAGISSILTSFIFGPLADRHGRRLMVLGGTLAVGVASLGGAWSGGIYPFFCWRLFGGVGLAAVMPNAIALAAEYAPARIRSFTVAACYTGYAIGASIGAALAARLIPAYGWQSVLIIGGFVPIAVVVLTLPILPESIRFLVLRQPDGAQIRRELRRINARWQFAADCIFTSSEHPATKTPMRDLFRDGRAGATLLIWLIFLMNLMETLFLVSWTPTLIHNAGMALAAALKASMVMQIGAITGGLLIAAAMDRWHPAAALVPIHLVGLAGVAGFGMVIGAGPMMYVMVLLIGIGVLGAQNGMNGLAATLYPTAIRSTGVSAALGAGRIGIVVGPLLGGAMVALGLSVPMIFLFAALPPLVSSAAIIALWRRSRARTSPR